MWWFAGVDADTIAKLRALGQKKAAQYGPATTTAATDAPAAAKSASAPGTVAAAAITAPPTTKTTTTGAAPEPKKKSLFAQAREARQAAATAATSTPATSTRDSEPSAAPTTTPASSTAAPTPAPAARPTTTRVKLGPQAPAPARQLPPDDLDTPAPLPVDERLKGTRLEWLLPPGQAEADAPPLPSRDPQADLLALASGEATAGETHLRFDFRGELLDASADVPTHLGLHHHGDEPDKVPPSVRRFLWSPSVGYRRGRTLESHCVV